MVVEQVNQMGGEVVEDVAMMTETAPVSPRLLHKHKI